MSEEVKNVLDEYIEKFVNKNPSKQSRELFNNIKGKLKKIPSKDLNNLIDFSGHNIVDKKYNAIYFVIEDLIEQTEEYKELSYDEDFRYEYMLRLIEFLMNNKGLTMSMLCREYITDYINGLDDEDNKKEKLKIFFDKLYILNEKYGSKKYKKKYKKKSKKKSKRKSKKKSKRKSKRKSNKR